MVSPPSENGPATPMAISNISVPGLHDDVMGSAGEEGSHGHHTVYAKNGPVPVLVGRCIVYIASYIRI